MKLSEWFKTMLNMPQFRDWPTVSKQCGVPYHTLRRLALGRADKLNLEDAETLYGFFRNGAHIADHLTKGKV